MLKKLSTEEGFALVEDVRKAALDPEWFAAVTSRYEPAALSGLEGRTPYVMREIEDNITDLVVIYTFAGGERLVGKFFLPVVKTDPWLGFAKLDDRGGGIDLRMRLMQQAIRGTSVDLPRPLLYDPDWRVLWQEFISDDLVQLASCNWSFALERVARALASAHRSDSTPESGARIENKLFRDYLIAYPFSDLEPLLAGGFDLPPERRDSQSARARGSARLPSLGWRRCRGAPRAAHPAGP